MTATRPLRPFALGACLVLLVGCQDSTLPPKADPDEARTALTTALTAWTKNANPTDELTKGTPPIFFNEPRCQSGVQLVGFKIDEGHAMYGQTVRLAVVLSITHKDGSVVDRKVTYLIDTAPAVVISPG